MLGFETIGNATVIVHDGSPILATDPWLNGDAYFGSWGLSHPIPEEQIAHVKACRYVWLSHAHPDHTNFDSLLELTHCEILLADHVGGRMKADLETQGFRVRIVPSARWVSLSPRIRVFMLADRNQDSILLIDVNGTLLLDLNDAQDHGWGRICRSIARTFRRSYLLRLYPASDADMMNFFSEDGKREVPPYIARRAPVGAALQADASRFHVSRVIPFSSFHRYQRDDSVWANEFTLPLNSYREGASAAGPEILDPFVRVNCETGEVTPLRSAETSGLVRPASDFGDDWSHQLDADDKRKLKRYILAKEKLRDSFGFIRFRVGGEDTTIDLDKNNRAGITFEVPRHSLMLAVKHRVFDDLLIGNYMKTTLHGPALLYLGFSPVVGKYADNGLAQSREELKRYFAIYRGRDPVGHLLFALREKSNDVMCRIVRSRDAGLRTAGRIRRRLISIG
ncbi:MAG TPA: hypothetical protein VGR73_12270 [Bryobacteraceae bacterium]|nr:hypothetical protein [Bryobacteraceae bacterium]